MDDCCGGRKPTVKEGKVPCPACGVVGRPVGDVTLEAILRPEAVAALLPVERRFCRTPSCSVLYYGPDGQRADKADALVRVGVKEANDPIPICYCFGFTRADVREEVARTGASTIPARITAEVRAGRCACERKNPGGTCCLGEVNRVVMEVKDALRGGVALELVPPGSRLHES
jgi:hypothetical protein